MRNPMKTLVTRHLSLVTAVALALSSATAAETVTIASAADWASFANRVNDGDVSLGAVMTADIALSQDSPRVGTTSAFWQGEFDGAGHTLTVNWNFTGTEYAAPFAVIKACKIHDLHVAGSIMSDAKFAAGLVGYIPAGGSSEYATIERCRVSAALTFMIEGDATGGGFIARHADSTSSKAELRDCLFDGSLLGLSAHSCGGFVGWKPGNAYLNLYNCLFAPASVTVSDTSGFTLSRSNSETYDIDKGKDTCYYTQAYGRRQGNNASSMTAEELAAALGSNWTVSNGKAMLTQFANPQSPPEPAAAGFVYQGALRDAQGGALSEKNHTIEFRLYDAATGGIALWARSYAVRLDDEGLFNAALHDEAGDAIGDEPGTGLPGILARYAGTTLYVGLTVAGSGAEIAPRQKLLSVPYATYAADLHSAKGDFAAAGALSAGVATFSGFVDAASLATSGGATVGDIAVGGVITGLGAMPLGGIALWSGSAGDIPDGWALCNGQTVNGRTTPDLRNRFLVGAAGEYAVSAIGGEKTHTLTENEMPNHRHSYSFHGADLDLSWDNDNNFYDASDHYNRDQNKNTKHTDYAGGNQPHENRPPYYALCYIMRVR